MHGLQGAEAQGPTLERGPTGCKEIIFFAVVTTAFCKQTHTLIFSDALVVVAYIVTRGKVSFRFDIRRIFA